jgi:hypothetical protein
MLEVYQAYTDYEGMAQLTRTLYQTVAREVFGSTTLRLADGGDYDIGGEWAQISLFGAVSKALGEEVSPATGSAELLRHAERVDLAVDPGWLPGKLVEKLFEHLVVPHLHVPTFVKDFPVDTSPTRSWLTRSCNGSVSRPRPRSRRPVMTRRCSSTRTSWLRWSTECRQVAAWEWGSTGCSWRSPVRVSVRPSCFRWYGHNERTARRPDFAILPEMG